MTESFWIFFELSINFFECIVFVWFLAAYLGEKYSGKRGQLGFCAAVMVMFVELTFFNRIIVFEFFSSFCAAAILVLYARFFLRGKWVLQTFLAIFSQAVIACAMVSANLLISAIFQISAFRLVANSDVFRLVFVLSGNILFFAVIQTVLRIKKAGRLSIRAGWVLLINPLLSVLSLCCIMEMAMALPEGDLFPFASIIIIMIMNIFTYKMFLDTQKHSENKLKLELLRQQQHNQAKSVTQSRRALRDISVLKHDMRNTNLVLLSYLKSGEIGKAVEELERQNTAVDEDNRKNYTTYVALNGLLAFKAEEAQEKGVSLSVDVLLNTLGVVDEAEFCVIVGNLVDNAVEHAVGLRAEDKTVWVKICNDRNYLSLTVQNCIYRSVLKENAALQTSKRVKKFHGLGLYSVRKTSEKYNGIVDIFEQAGRFCVNVHLNVSETASK